MKNSLCQLAVLSLLIMLSACGGGDDKKKAPSICTENLVFFIVCAFGSSGSAPDKEQDSGIYSIDMGKDSAALGQLGDIDEYEPNNLLDNANIVNFPGGSASTGEGIRLHGSVQSTDDIADYFIFTPKRSSAHHIYLCADTCNESVADESVYIMIYDQNQTTIASTPVGTMARQEFTVELTAGLAYYIEVNGYAAADRYDYRLAVIE
ncbi:MAG: hypothetical protein IIA11_09615 [Proteobacteria bacterium]|nr:hypothetical protein [Pseudomonadota bacterium]